MLQNAFIREALLCCGMSSSEARRRRRWKGGKRGSEEVEGGGSRCGGGGGGQCKRSRASSKDNLSRGGGGGFRGGSIRQLVGLEERREIGGRSCSTEDSSQSDYGSEKVGMGTPMGGGGGRRGVQGHDFVIIRNNGGTQSCLQVNVIEDNSFGGEGGGGGCLRGGGQCKHDQLTRKYNEVNKSFN